MNVPVLGKEQSIHPAFSSIFFCTSLIVANVGTHLSNSVCVTYADKSAINELKSFILACYCVGYSVIQVMYAK